MDRLYPLVQYAYVRDELINRNEQNRVLSHIFILSQLNKSNFEFGVKKFDAVDTLLPDGSMPISFQKEGVTWKYQTNETNYPLEKEDKVYINAFNNFLGLCNKYHIHLILAFPPNFHPIDKVFEKRVEELTMGRAKLFVYDTTDSLYQNKQMFYDLTHLNSKGARIFTNDIIRFLIKDSDCTRSRSSS